MSKRDGKDLLTTLRENSLLEYGATFTGADVRDILGIDTPDLSGMSFDTARRVMSRISLAEMAATDYVRAHLLNEGKYLKSVNGDYRVLMPSENENQVQIYIESATGKLLRGGKLLRNTPADAIKDAARNHLLTGIAMKRTSGRNLPGSLRKKKPE